MSRSIVLLLATLTALACAPPASTYDAGCYPAPYSYPALDAGSVVANCGWNGGCNAESLTTQFHAQFDTNGTCSAASDCALYGEPDGGSSFQYLCYKTSYTQPINASMRAGLDACLQQMIATFCGQCFPDGGLVQGDIVPPQQDAGSCVEVECVSAHCSATIQ